ncbi:class I SAM-dependent methyltransferase [Fodinicurvata sediminis]|uniref:class I SAM-dependent methyltransferase n=1 Tax=Fodinicurvata sediminis TaxID=1121832 RepID=UPI000414178E|nr:class I SAM-dependent methyltransferase [Fodinicurvata sediminis]
MSSAELHSIAPDQAQAEAFAEQVMGLLNAGAVSVMISIGHRASLFDVMAGLPPTSSAVIAERAGLAERYVREWLAVMVTGGLVAYDTKIQYYHLPPEHAACLTRDAILGNLAVYGQHVAIMGAMQEEILDRFHSGEGAVYGDYPCFHQIMAEDSNQTVTGQLFDTILPLAEGVDARLEEGIDVLDAGCGRGSALIAMARQFPRSRFLGYDLCPDAIDHASFVVEQEGLANIRFEVRDLTGYDEKNRFDFITSFDAVHDQKDPQALIQSLHDALKPGGIYLMQDIGGSARLENNLDFPMASLLYAVSCVHCMPVSLGQGGKGLGTMWGWETAEAMLKAAGFREVQRHVLPHDPMNVWFVSRA